MTRCRIPKNCEQYKIVIGIYVVKSKRIFPRSVKQRDKCVYIHKNDYCVSWKKIKTDSLRIGVEEIDRNFKCIKSKINEKNFSQRNLYRFPKHETKDQLENVFVFDLETINDREFAEAFAAGIYDVNLLRDRWNRDLTPDELKTEKDNVILFDGSNGNPVMSMLEYISENHEVDERTYFYKDGDEIVSSYGILLVAHSASGFDSWVVLNALVEKTAEWKLKKPLGD